MKKDAINLKEREQKYMGGFGERKGEKDEMLRLHYNFKTQSSQK